MEKITWRLISVSKGDKNENGRFATLDWESILHGKQRLYRQFCQKFVCDLTRHSSYNFFPIVSSREGRSKAGTVWSVGQHPNCILFWYDINNKANRMQSWVEPTFEWIWLLTSSFLMHYKNPFVVVKGSNARRRVYAAMVTQRAHNVEKISYWRRCDLIMSHRRQYDVVTMSCACWVRTDKSLGDTLLRELDYY